MRIYFRKIFWVGMVKTETYQNANVLLLLTRILIGFLFLMIMANCFEFTYSKIIRGIKKPIDIFIDKVNSII